MLTHADHGANMIPYLVAKYAVRTLAELGVCTGMSTVNVIARYAYDGAYRWGAAQSTSASSPASSGLASGRRLATAGSAQEELRAAAPRRLAAAPPPLLEKYYLVDPWGGQRCKPGCACTKNIRMLAKAWPEVLTPLKGYSVPMATYVPNGTLDLVYVDAAHDYRNVRNDILAWWHKLRPNGVMAGHDFAHWRNWAEARHDKQTGRGGWAVGKRGDKGPKLPPPYGVGQATQELFSHCTVHVRFNTWWVERGECNAPLPIASDAEAV